LKACLADGEINIGFVLIATPERTSDMIASIYEQRRERKGTQLNTIHFPFLAPC